GHYFFDRRLAGQDQYMLCIRRGLQGKEEVLIDPLPMSAEHRISAEFRSFSRDGTLLAYSTRQGGEDETTLHLLDVETGKELDDHFVRASYASVEILPDKKGMYISRREPSGPRVFFHKIGSNSADDTEIFGKGYGRDRGIGLNLSDDGRYMVFRVGYGSSPNGDIWVQDLDSKGPIIPIIEHLNAGLFAQTAGDRMFLRTNWKAPRW